MYVGRLHRATVFCLATCSESVGKGVFCKKKFWVNLVIVHYYIFDWTDHNTGQGINLNRHDMSELQDMLANTFKMERGKKSDKKWRDAHTYKAEQEAIRTKEVAEFTERKKAESKQIIEAIKENSNKLTQLQKAIDDLLSATSVPEESLNPVSETDRKTAASSIAAMAEETIGPIYQFMWDTAVLRINQLASEIRVSMGGQSVGGSNGRSAQRDACPSKNADELTNWDGTKKKGFGW